MYCKRFGLKTGFKINADPFCYSQTTNLTLVIIKNSMGLTNAGNTRDYVSTLFNKIYKVGLVLFRYSNAEKFHVILLRGPLAISGAEVVHRYHAHLRTDTGHSKENTVSLRYSEFTFTQPYLHCCTCMNQ